MTAAQKPLSALEAFMQELQKEKQISEAKVIYDDALTPCKPILFKTKANTRSPSCRWDLTGNQVAPQLADAYASPLCCPRRQTSIRNLLDDKEDAEDPEAEEPPMHSNQLYALSAMMRNRAEKKRQEELARENQTSKSTKKQGTLQKLSKQFSAMSPVRFSPRPALTMTALIGYTEGAPRLWSVLVTSPDFASSNM